MSAYARAEQERPVAAADPLNRRYVSSNAVHPQLPDEARRLVADHDPPELGPEAVPVPGGEDRHPRRTGGHVPPAIPHWLPRGRSRTAAISVHARAAGMSSTGGATGPSG